MRLFLRALLLVVPLYATSIAVFPDAIPVAEAKAKKAKKKKPKKEKVVEAAPEIGADGLPSGDAPAGATKVRKVTAAAIVKWSKKGESDGEILSRVEAAGYVASKKDIKLLQKKKVSRDLIAALGGPAAGPTKASARMEMADATPAPKAKVDLTKPAAVKDIDFDDVAPPPGTPGWVEDKQKSDAPATKIDRSTRPSNPAEESPARPEAKPADASATGESAPAAPRIRKPIVATD